MNEMDVQYFVSCPFKTLKYPCQLSLSFLLSQYKKLSEDGKKVFQQGEQAPESWSKYTTAVIFVYDKKINFIFGKMVGLQMKSRYKKFYFC